MGVTTTKTNKPLNPRGNDQSPLAFNRAKLYSGKALDFDGVNDKLSTDYAPSLNIQTTAYWVKLDNLSTPYALGGFVNGTTDMFGLYYWGNESNKNFGFNSWNADSYGIILPDFVDDWFHVVAEYNFSDFTQSKLFVNGQELSISQTKGTTLQRTTASRTFKIDSPSGSQKMNGKISGTKVFNTALTAAQVADLYNNPEKVVPTGVDNTALKLWLPMMEGAGTTAYDGSGNGNHGTISGATYVNGVGAPVSQSAVMDWNKGVNLMIYSEQFDNAAWQTTSATVTANDTTAPDGSETADKIEFTASNAEIMDQFVNVASSLHIGSVFLKNDTIGSVQVEIIGGAPGILGQTTIDLTDGSLSASVGDYTPVATDAGNGWYRVSVGDTGDATIASPALKIKRVSANGSFYAWGAQVEAADSLGAYIPNHTGTPITTPVLLPQGLTTGRDITGVNLFENVRKQGALNLDGNSWAEVHDNASVDFGTGSFTLEAWVKVDAVDAGSSFNAILSIDGDVNNGTGLAIITSLIPRIEYGGNNTGNSTLTRNDWAHLVGTFDGTNVTFYINGAQDDQDARTAVDITNADVKYIGRDTTSVRQYPNQIAQPRIYNRALTAEEVQRNYNAGKNTYTNS